MGGVGVWETVTIPRTTRRKFLQTSVTAAGAIFGLPMAIDRVGTQDDSEPFSPGAYVYDFDRGRSQKDLVITNDPDPAENRGFVVHITSDGTETRDYAAIILPTGGLALGQLESMSYEYYEQPQNTTTAPDEVWLLLVTGAEESRKQHILGQSFNDGAGAQRWRKRDVYAEITGEVEHNEWIEMISTQNFVSRDANLIERYGEHARVVRVALGIGGAMTLGKTVTNLYLDNFEINGDVKGLPTME